MTNLLKIAYKKLINAVFAFKVFLFLQKNKNSYNQLKVYSNFVIISIAFNNLEIIGVQYKYLKKNLKDNFDYIVVDNSSNLEIGQQIKEFCKTSGINYVKLPNNLWINKNSSVLHGLALNWSYNNIICNIKPKYFGFVDHDIFPITETYVLKNLLNYPIFGLLQERAEMWYLWPGFSFFAFDFLKDKKIDFLPKIEMEVDTGGSNYNSVYSKIKKKETLINHEEYFKIIDNGSDNAQLNKVSLMGDWLHLINISQWKENSINKIDFVEDLILKILSK